MSHKLDVPALLFICVGWTMVGCAAGESVQTDCQDVSERLESCFGGSATVVSCDTEQTSQIMGRSCDELTVLLKDSKSDLGRSLARAGCRWGFYQFCPVPTCDPEADEPVSELPAHGLDTPSDCAVDALQYEGCGACNYYTCREAEAQCGEDGYLLNYAHRYCNQFRLVTEPNVSRAGQMWLRKIRRCLITTLDRAEPSTDCQSISDEGFGSHPQCYVDTGFCDLPISDWAAVLATIDTLDFSFRESFITGNKCLRDYLIGGSR